MSSPTRNVGDMLEVCCTLYIGNGITLWLDGIVEQEDQTRPTAGAYQALVALSPISL